LGEELEVLGAVGGPDDVRHGLIVEVGPKVSCLDEALAKGP
jgi:hypothetical protein